MSARTIVVGAGAAGLGAATALAAQGPVLVVERMPVAGGSAGHDSPDVRAAVARAERAGVALALGATAMRWEAGRLLVCAPGAIRRHAARRLVFAGGLRPATSAELGLAGERPAGVLPMPVAKHLLEAGVPLWRRAVVVGDGFGAAEAARLIRAGGGSVTVVGPAAPAWADATWAGWRAVAVLGHDHVAGLRVERDGAAATIDCDAVLLAASPRPVRNVEGAIAAGAPGVAFVQDVPAGSFAETVAAAAASAGRNAAAVAA